MEELMTSTHERKMLHAQGLFVCSACEIVKPLHEFGPGEGPWGVRYYCIACERAKAQAKLQAQAPNRKRYRSKAERQALLDQGLRHCQKCNQDLPKEQFSRPSGYCRACRALNALAEYYKHQKERSAKRSATIKADYALNPEKYRERTRKSRERQKEAAEGLSVDELLALGYSVLATNKERLVLRKEASAIKVALHKQISNGLTEMFSGRKKSSKTETFLGLSFMNFKRYLEELWTPEMSWDNYGVRGWHIDHILPKKCFNPKSDQDLKICWNFRNLRPLWAYDNDHRPHAGADLTAEELEPMLTHFGKDALEPFLPKHLK